MQLSQKKKLIQAYTQALIYLCYKLQISCLSKQAINLWSANTDKLPRHRHVNL